MMKMMTKKEKEEKEEKEKMRKNKSKINLIVLNEAYTNACARAHHD